MYVAWPPFAAAAAVSAEGCASPPPEYETRPGVVPAPGALRGGSGTTFSGPPASSISTGTLNTMRVKSDQMVAMRSLNSLNASFLYATIGSIWANPRRWMPSRR